MDAFITFDGKYWLVLLSDDTDMGACDTRTQAEEFCKGMKENGEIENWAVNE